MTEAALALLFGLLIGSFLNVCIYRMPRDLSVVQPRSFCPGCERPIAWYDNIPLVSYALLRGRCRHCRTSISKRYPAVELLTGLLFFVIVWRLGFGPLAIKALTLASILVALAFTDLEERILPDQFTLGGIPLGFVFAWFVPLEDYLVRGVASLSGFALSPRQASLGESVLGALLPAAFLWLAGFLFEKIRHKEGLGLGDVKMVAMIGAFLGLRGALTVLVAGSLLGSVVGLLYILLTRKNAGSYELPMGTFLALGGLAVLLISPA